MTCIVHTGGVASNCVTCGQPYWEHSYEYSVVGMRDGDLIGETHPIPPAWAAQVKRLNEPSGK